MKKLIILGIIVIAAVALLLFGKFGNPLGEEFKLYAYTLNGQSNNAASLAVPFTSSFADGRFINAAVDLDGDGTFGPEEWVVKNLRPRVSQDTKNLLHFSLPAPISPEAGKLNVAAALSKDSLSDWDGGKAGLAYQTAQAAVTPVELADVFGVNVPGSGPDVYRGSTGSFLKNLATPALANSHETDVYTPLNVPDYSQGNMECAPASAANNLTGLASANNAQDRLPSQLRDLIEELKRDMNFNNGVFGADNFVNGKNAFAARHNLPITTRVIERPSMQDIVTAIESGCAIEMDLAFVEIVDGHAGRHVASHTVTVTGAYADGQTSLLYGHDSATPEGVEQWQFSGRGPNTQIGYRFWDGATVVTRIFVQCWTPPVEENSGTAPESDQTSTGNQQQTSQVEMLVIDGVYYPKKQFHVAQPDACGQPHYHAEVAYGLTGRDSMEVVSASDPNPRGCGFGAVSEVPVATIPLTYEQSMELVKYLVD